ncbi:MAG TPA: bifunctional phosphoribosylaminoimidazolecarboxamide formyltransferase/IMP cyclohydrolase [Micromonosporaceae bacterium]|jgi:phosphoribosylaminoimidazolecarboxamide formyltransferase/IMP cyclohydrolase|nr:bifunctional phosphoribosylaminoimidazolecarboxamide formyltransferase/IMP cyclohydrolase [Micromonosporaceae bacterium]
MTDAPTTGTSAGDGGAPTGTNGGGVPNTGLRPIKRALISVYDKTGLDDLVHALAAAGAQIVSTGTTAAHIESLGVAVTRVEEVTGFPECLDGRVKTLHPAIHAGLLADLRLDSHAKQIADLGIAPFDLLVSNLYPFADTVASGADRDEVIEKIDIGGPAMVRSAAKNHANLAVVTSPAAYPEVIKAAEGGGFTFAQRRALAARAFADIAVYDIAIGNWFSVQEVLDADVRWPAWGGLSTALGTVLRYGENPHQLAALYVDVTRPPGLAQATQLQGKEMSYNNYIDADAAWRSANDFAPPCVAIIKHQNPCGIAVGADVAEAHRKAHACDPQSAYGGIIAVNRAVTAAMAAQLKGVFTEVIVAPSYDDDALELLAKKKDLRVLVAPTWTAEHIETRQIGGGLLVQVSDRVDAPGDDPSTWTLATGSPVDAATLQDLAFAWRAIRSVKSNAILLARDGATVGIGMGQVNRVDAARLAVSRAGAERVTGAVGASDAYFPFPDALEVLIQAGVRAVVEPGGSIHDPEVIAAAEAAGITLYLTGTRHFFH